MTSRTSSQFQRVEGCDVRTLCDHDAPDVFQSNDTSARKLQAAQYHLSIAGDPEAGSHPP